MAIMVHFRDDTVCFVPDRDLGDLILSDRIVAFRRGMEWVTLAASSIQQYTPQARKTVRDKRGSAVKRDVWKRIMITDAC